MKNCKLIFLILIFLNNYIISHSIEPDVFVQSTVNRASKILSEDLTKKEKIDKLKLIAKETVDIRGIGFYTLGAVRKNLSDNEKTKYSELFESYFFWPKIPYLKIKIMLSTIILEILKIKLKKFVIQDNTMTLW